MAKVTAPPTDSRSVDSSAVPRVVTERLISEAPLGDDGGSVFGYFSRGNLLARAGRPNALIADTFALSLGDGVPLSVYNEVIERAIKAESKMESSNAFKWFVTARSAIEEFEDTHFRKIRIEVPKDINDVFEKRRLRRQMKWQHILEKCEEYDVKKLLHRLEQNKILKDEFCLRISVAYGMLSKIIHNAVLTPGSGQISFSFLTTDEDVNKAIQIFMQGFEIKDQIIETIK
ncbi:uncharacterized protein LOC112598379 [Melanaphis sacchari]|uniref:uncharacterized protein LOC112598379 n=1 Tax=Melanaphis sacchari TaxID=742174 RepID=UPI000DC147CE|nr:uncharacterized protein LOC112598379 [Melanaphis sacchari]